MVLFSFRHVGVSSRRARFDFLPREQYAHCPSYHHASSSGPITTISKTTPIHLCFVRIHVGNRMVSSPSQAWSGHPILAGRGPLGSLLWDRAHDTVGQPAGVRAVHLFSILAFDV